MISQIKITDKQKFDHSKQNIVDGWFDNLYIISDFDKTMTHAFVHGKSIPSLISVLRDQNYLTTEYPTKAHALFDYYHPIETDITTSLSEKKLKMEDRRTKHSELLIQSWLNKYDIKQISTSRNIQFREKLKEIIILLANHDSPFVILSANWLWEESISTVLDQHQIDLSNIFIISNNFVRDKNGYAIDYQKPQIHTFNKNWDSLKTSPIYDKIQSRKNIILLGDSIWDASMADWLGYQDILKIWFLNQATPELIQEYQKHFDVIITEDGDINFLYEILQEIKQ